MHIVSLSGNLEHQRKFWLHHVHGLGRMISNRTTIIINILFLEAWAVILAWKSSWLIVPVVWWNRRAHRVMWKRWRDRMPAPLMPSTISWSRLLVPWVWRPPERSRWRTRQWPRGSTTPTCPSSYFNTNHQRWFENKNQICTASHA